MASLASNPLLEELQDELLCQICVLSNDLRELPCQHSYCVDCINKMKHMFSKKLTCPECRATHRLPKDKADGFPPNRLASRLNETLARHKESGSFNYGYLSDEYGSSLDSVTSDILCRHIQHQGPVRPCDVYCQFCRNLLCAKCGLMTRCANHRNHKCEDIEVACQKARKTLSDCKDILEAESDRIQHEIDRTHARIEEFRNNRVRLDEELLRIRYEIQQSEQLSQEHQNQLELIRQAEKMREQNKELLPSSTSLTNSASEYHQTAETLLRSLFEIFHGLYIFVAENPVLAIIFFSFLIFISPYGIPTQDSYEQHDEF